MTLERLLVVALALTSTLAAGLAADLAGDMRLPGGRLLAVIVANVVALPALAYALVVVMGPGLGAAGLVVAAAAPGGSTGPLLAVLGRGDARVAAVLFVVLTLAGMVAALAVTIALDVGSVSSVALAGLVVVACALGPLVVGLAVRARRPAVARRLQPWCSRASLLLLAATVVVLAVRHGAAARVDDLVAGAVLTAAALAIGAIAGDRATRVAVAQVSAVRNLTLGLLVLTVVGAPPAQTMAVLAYGLAMYVITLGAAAWWRRVP